MLDHDKLDITDDGRTERRWRFDHHRLDAWHVALEALVRGEAIVKALPRGYGTLGDQLRRALSGAFTQTTEAAARTGADRLARFRIARAEAGEAAGALEALERLGVADPSKVDEAMGLLWRLSAMLCRLAKLKR
jgi:four helix bundle protein